MTKDILGTMKLVHILCSIIGFYYVKDFNVLNRKGLCYKLFELLDVIRCCLCIYVVFYTSVFEHHILNSSIFKIDIQEKPSLTLVLEFLEVNGYNVGACRLQIWNKFDLISSFGAKNKVVWKVLRKV